MSDAELKKQLDAVLNEIARDAKEDDEAVKTLRAEVDAAKSRLRELEARADRARRILAASSA